MTRMNADERLEQAPYKENSASGTDKRRPIHTLPEGNAKSAMEEYFSLVSTCLRQIQPQDVRKSHQVDECAGEDELIFGTPRGKSGPLIPNLALWPWRDHDYAPQKLSEPSSSSIFTNLHFSCKKARRRLPQAIWRHLRHFCIRHACELRSSPLGSGAIRKLAQNRATRMMTALSMRRRLLADHIESISLRGQPVIAFYMPSFWKINAQCTCSRDERCRDGRAPPAVSQTSALVFLAFLAFLATLARRPATKRKWLPTLSIPHSYSRWDGLN